MDIDAVVRMSLAAHAEAAAATEQQVGEIVQRLQSAIANTLPECILEDFCVCRGGRVFDGVECVDGTPWAARATQLVAPAGLPHVDPANPASPEVYVSLPETLLSMPGNRKAELRTLVAAYPTPQHTLTGVATPSLCVQLNGACGLRFKCGQTTRRTRVKAHEARNARTTYPEQAPEILYSSTCFRKPVPRNGDGRDQYIDVN